MMVEEHNPEAAEQAAWRLLYLLCFPAGEGFQSQPVTEPERLSEAPYFQPIDLTKRLLNSAQIMVEETAVAIQPQILDDSVQVVECWYAVPQLLSSEGIARKNQIELALQRKLLPETVRASGLWEAYSILTLVHNREDPQALIESHNAALARLLRDEQVVLSPFDVNEILQTRHQYAPLDMTVIDWSGALIVAADGSIQDEIELLKIGNYQLLKYRMLDQAIELRLTKLREKMSTRRRTFLAGLGRREVKQIVEEKLSLLLDFERVDQNLLMIGDWYTAKLYRSIIEEFYLDDWQSTVKNKLESFQSILTVVQENFTISWAVFLDLIQLVGWLILLLGYFILFYFDVIALWF